MICTCIANKTYTQILDILAQPEVEMAEIRLDSCPLQDEDAQALFSEAETPLIATCRAASLAAARGFKAPAIEDWNEAARRLSSAIEAGARFADLEIEAPASVSKRIQRLCRDCGTELIRSYHDFSGTPDDEMLQMALARCFRYGADIAKVATLCRNEDDVRRIESLYSVILEGVDSLQGRLVAFGMGEAASASRIDCLMRGAPFTYAGLDGEDPSAPGQWTTSRMRGTVYPQNGCSFRAEGLRMPPSKSFAQRAIVAAALAQGTSHLSGYAPCGDCESAIEIARSLGAEVSLSGSTLTIKGIGPIKAPLGIKTLHTGESGLLTRLCIPLAAALCDGDCSITGEGTLLKRPLSEAGAIMAAFGVILNPEGERKPEVHVPLKIKGKLIPGTADIPGGGGSQLVSGLLMALPLCSKDSNLYVSEPKSIPYMYLTLEMLRRFGVSTRSEMEGDAEMLARQDWSYCTGITFAIRAGQRYKACDLNIEADWSAAAVFLTAGAIFGSASLEGLDMGSLQADLSIIDILVEAGAVVSQTEAADGIPERVCACKAPLEGFSTDLNHAPDLFPVVSILAAFCAGESRIAGLGRLAGKESDRADAIVQMLTNMGVENEVCGDTLVIQGETLASRILHRRLLRGGEYSSRHDHRVAMALQLASLGADSPILIDDRKCVCKSYPDFFEMFRQ